MDFGTNYCELAFYEFGYRDTSFQCHQVNEISNVEYQFWLEKHNLGTFSAKYTYVVLLSAHVSHTVGRFAR